jgi:hypothetical protein
MLVVKKWCASHWLGKVQIAQISVKETTKRWTLIKGPDDGKTDSARGFRHTFEKDPPQLFDTEVEALVHLRENCDAQCCASLSAFNRSKQKLFTVVTAIKELTNQQ